MSSDQAIRPRARPFAKTSVNVARVLETFCESVILQSCLTCASFHEESEICQKFKARPPARVIVHACPDYMDNDEIPF